MRTSCRDSTCKMMIKKLSDPERTEFTSHLNERKICTSQALQAKSSQPKKLNSSSRDG
jgi:hypothetical protein